MKYRKKPIVIEAVQFLGDWYDLPEWAKNATRRPADSLVHGLLQVPTLEGVMTCLAGDWLIQGVKGEVYPCKPDIFEATYEPAEHEPGCRCILCLH